MPPRRGLKRSVRITVGVGLSAIARRYRRVLMRPTREIDHLRQLSSDLLQPRNERGLSHQNLAAAPRLTPLSRRGRRVHALSSAVTPKWLE